MPDALIYTRVSHLNRSISIRDQEKECRAVCERNDWPVRSVFCDDGISASRYGKERPAWSALKAELQAGDILVVWEASRANRDMAEYVALRELCTDRGVLLSYSGRILDLSRGDDRFVSGLDVLVAERESELIKERVLRGKRSAAAEGRASNRPPWGYRQKTEPSTGAPIPCAWEHDPVEAPRVKEAVKRFLKGETQWGIYRWLEDTEGWTPANTRSLQRALMNPALAGLKVYKGELIGKGQWEPIISQGLHNAVVNRVKGLKRAYGCVSFSGPEPIYLLSGIARCEVCKEPLYRKKYKTSVDAYGCQRGHVGVSAEELDRRVEDELLEILAKINPAPHRGDNPEVQRAIQEIAEIEAELDEWIAAAGRREVGPTAFAKIEKDLRNRIAILRPKTVGKAVVPWDYSKIQRAWPRSTMRQKRDVIRAFLTITVSPSELDIPDCCERCGKGNVYARGLCQNCYRNAWKGRFPMPPKRRKDRVVIAPI
ncbi:recombinase family protein [Mycobacterium sp. CnD-18-1]|uniref:recombinase family protein n=1 Tax=Mycobacterium sp. CnD-18-1 TaxID=2917744 RepID=UPI001EF1A396|nr:recombinase family protein [Mycobacterium sp. CnD-18-1]MCG7607190.1 recombinase family protein [Mycobacterium sp. CnD-18-1]